MLLPETTETQASTTPAHAMSRLSGIYPAGLSVGVTGCDPATSKTALLADCDTKMYRAKGTRASLVRGTARAVLPDPGGSLSAVPPQ